MNIIIVDDDSLVAGALKTILEINPDINITATGSDGQEACELYRRYQPDILLMDIRMKNMSGLEASALILKEFPDARILLLTTFSDDEYIIKSAPPGSERLSFETGLCQHSSRPPGSILRADCIRHRDRRPDSTTASFLTLF